MQRPDKHAIIALEELLSAALLSALVLRVSGQPQTIIIYNLYTTASLDGRHNLKQLQTAPLLPWNKIRNEMIRERRAEECAAVWNLGVILV